MQFHPPLLVSNTLTFQPIWGSPGVTQLLQVSDPCRWVHILRAATRNATQKAQRPVFEVDLDGPGWFKIRIDPRSQKKRQFTTIIHWLVVLTILKNLKVNGKLIIPYIMEH